jgi:hypothetical protein
MTLRTPDQSLLASRSDLSEFYLTFSRYEFALKATGFAKQTVRGAQIDWDKLARELGELEHLLTDRRAEIEELLDRPPKRLNLVDNDQLKWQEDSPKPTWGPTRVFLYRVQAVRNNLMHGSKFIDQESIDPQRETKLLASAVSALEIILNRLPNTKDAFNSAAPQQFIQFEAASQLGLIQALGDELG